MAKEKRRTTFFSTLKTIHWVLSLVFRFSPILIVLTLTTQLIATIVPFAEQKYLSHLIDSLIDSYTKHSSAWANIFIIFFSIRIVKVFFLNLQRVLQRLLDLEVQNNLRKFYVNKTSSLDYQQFENQKIKKKQKKTW